MRCQHWIKEAVRNTRPASGFFILHAKKHMTDSEYTRARIQLDGWECQRCGHRWRSRGEGKPGTCPECCRYDWHLPERDPDYHAEKAGIR